MKKILIIIFAIIYSLSGFSQFFSVDSRSMSVPRYANQTAINTAIPSPTEGMLVYNNNLDQFAYYTGTAWVNFPSAGGTPPPSYTTSVPIPTYANATAINAIASPITGMLVYNLATNEVWFRGASAWSAMPTAITPWATSGDNITYVGAGKTLAAGISAYAFPNGVVTLNSMGETNASPVMLVQSFAGNQNKIRYESGNFYQEQTFTHSTTPANASIAWNMGNAPSTNLTLFELSGNGNFKTDYFAAFGETSSGSVYNPAIATKTLTGTTSSSLNLNATFSLPVPAGRIVDIKVHVFDGTSVYTARGGSNAFGVHFTSSQLVVTVPSNSALLNKNFVAYITYIN